MMLALVWTIVSLLASGYALLTYWPVGAADNEFILFHDVSTLLLFLPSYFIFFFSIPSYAILVSRIDNNNKVPFIALAYVCATMGAVLLLDYSWLAGVAMAVIASSAACIHLSISALLWKISK